MWLRNKSPSFNIPSEEAGALLFDQTPEQGKMPICPNVNGLSPWVQCTEVYFKWAKTTPRYPLRSGTLSLAGFGD
jgi:hypothetical protein